MKVREPVARPVDVVALELLLSASQAFLVGVLMYLALGVWDDRGVGLGSVAIILALLGLAVGGGWLYWLLGGVGWPMAAASVPVAMFLGFALVLGWAGDDLFRVAGVPLLLAVLAAVYGVVGGVFIESPRRWRWDQRQRLRPGTDVPHVSEATRTVVAAVPRSLPRRVPTQEPTSDLAARIEQSTPVEAESGGDTRIPYAPPEDSPSVSAAVDAQDEADAAADARAADEPDAAEPAAKKLTPNEAEEPDELTSEENLPTMPTQRLERGARASAADSSERSRDQDSGAIELPTAIEPKAQRSPWAWAAPPDWNHDEDDQADSDRSSGHS